MSAHRMDLNPELLDTARCLANAIADPKVGPSLIDDICAGVEAGYGPDAVVAVSDEAARILNDCRWAARRWDGHVRAVATELEAWSLVRSANGEPSKRHWFTAVLRRDEPGGPWIEVASDV